MLAGMNQKSIPLISAREVHIYFEYLLNAFHREFTGVSKRQLIEQLARRSVFSSSQAHYLKQIVANGFSRKDPYAFTPLARHSLEHPIELLNYIVLEGYTPSTPFVVWAHKRLGVKWNAMHWFLYLMRDIAPVDLVTIRKEFQRVGKNILPQTLEFYYRFGVGLERIEVGPDTGIHQALRREFSGRETYKGFDPIEYIFYYYSLFDEEDMTIVETFYRMLLDHRSLLPKKSTALIVGNGPVPGEAQTLSMIPEINRIIPADVDSRNLKIMQMHGGNRNPLATQKARPAEEHADFIYYLFEKYTGVKYGLFAVREVTAVKTIDPVFVDVSRTHPLHVAKNTTATKKLRPDLVVVPFCPESITGNVSTYRRYLKNIASLVSQKGHVCMFALKDAKFYRVGKEKLEATPVNEEFISAELRKIGFANISIRTIHIPSPQLKRTRGFADSMIIWATKQ